MILNKPLLQTYIEENLKKLHDRFEALSFYIENTEDQINKRINEGLSTSSLDRHLERLQDEEYEIQCKIENLENRLEEDK
tara:strand:+ start:122 stop:361 length:240 start_codon:yes stop_codon:yes gene_type:complete